MSKHTPGPWVCDGNDITVTGEGCIAVAYGFVVDNKVVHTPETFANARLIALAPDLAETLNELVFCLDSPLLEGFAALIQPSLKKAKALKAKLGAGP